MPLIVILAECGIELIPKNLRSIPAIKRTVTKKNYTSQLLDNALHHSSMNKLQNYTKRGRPDITHICLLNMLGSTLNKIGKLKIYLHTVNNKIFEVNPEIRITRNFVRFKGLMAKLLIDGAIKTKEVDLITPVNNDLIQLINSLEPTFVALFSSKGKETPNYTELLPIKLSDNVVAIVGGFQKGVYSKYLFSLSENVISLSSFSLDAWVAIYRIISLYEMKFGIY